MLNSRVSEPNRPRIICFFCDIMGTILGKGENDMSQYQKFSELLAKLKEKEDADYIVFSLISSDGIEVIAQMQDILYSYIGETVVFGKQFFGDGYFTIDGKVTKTSPGKIMQIIEYVKELEGRYKVGKVYYADDCKIFHDMLSCLEDKLSFKIRSIIPQQNEGIFEVNQILEAQLSQEYYLRKKV